MRTHWKLKEGHSLLQKQYLAYIYEQQGLNTKQNDLRAAIHEFKECRCDPKQDECSSNSEGEDAETTELEVKKINSGLFVVKKQPTQIEESQINCGKRTQKKRTNITLKMR